jgi:ankyrin repeat protein
MIQEGNANPNFRVDDTTFFSDNQAATPLQSAVVRGNIASVKMMLENGGDPNIQNREGSTSVRIFLFDLIQHIIFFNSFFFSRNIFQIFSWSFFLLSYHYTQVHLSLIYYSEGDHDTQSKILALLSEHSYLKTWTILQDKKGRTALDVAKSIKDILPLGLNDLVLKMERESEGTTMEL